MPQLEDCINGETVLTSPVVWGNWGEVRSLSPQCPLHFCSPCPVSTTAERLEQATLLILILVLFGELIPSSGCFSIPPPPPQISPLLHFTPASNLLQINKGSCRGAPLTWPCLLILTQQLEGDVTEPVTLFIKSSGRRPRCHGLSDLCRLWMTANMD